MQLSLTQSKLLCLLLLPTLAMTAVAPVRHSTKIGTGPMNLVNYQHVNISRSLSLPTRLFYCKHDDPYPPWDPPYRSSLNNTFPETPDISQAFLDSVGINRGQGTYPFDCYLEIPGGIVVIEIKGEVDSDFRIAFEVWLSVLAANWEIGVYSCELFDLDKDPCAFNIDTKLFHGQGGIYPKDDADPKLIDLCVKIEGTLTIPLWSKKTVHYEHCFYKFPRGDEVTQTS